MPAAYAAAFTAQEAAEHARIVGRRAARLAHAESVKTASGSCVCVVADDRPGLLSLVTDALLVQGVGIRSGVAFCRQRPDGRAEAVDFFVLERPGSDVGVELELDAADLAAFLQSLSELISEDIQAIARVSSASVPPTPKSRVYFELEALRRGEQVLLVEAPDSPGLLHAITSALYAQTVRILSCQIGTEGGVARDRFEVASSDGRPLGSVELCDVQLAVLDALPQRQTR